MMGEAAQPENRSARKRRLALVVALPAATVLVSLGLTALSFIEIEMKGRRATARKPQAPVPADVLARYREESRKLQAIRTEARAGLTAEDVLTLIEKGKEIPLPEKLVGDLRAVEARSPDSTRAILPRALSLVKRLYREGTEEHGPEKHGSERIRAAEAVLAHAVLSGTSVELDAESRKDLLDVLEAAVRREGSLAPSCLALLARIGRAEDLERLERIRDAAGSRQAAHEVTKAIEAIRKRAVARG